MSYKLNNHAYSKQIREGYETIDMPSGYSSNNPYDIARANDALSNLTQNGGATVGVYDSPPGSLSQIIYKDNDHPPSQTGKGNTALLRLPLLMSPQHAKTYLRTATEKINGQDVFILGPPDQYRDIIDMGSISAGYTQDDITNSYDMLGPNATTPAILASQKQRALEAHQATSEQIILEAQKKIEDEQTIANKIGDVIGIGAGTGTGGGGMASALANSLIGG